MPFNMGANFGEESGILKGYIKNSIKQFTRFALVPVMVPRVTAKPHLASDSEALAIVAELERLSKKYETKFRMEDKEIVISVG
jgi:hypothetical protein